MASSVLNYSPPNSAAVELTSLSPYHKNLGRPKPAPETGFLIDLVYEIIALVQKPQLVGCSNNCQTASVLAEILWSTLLIVGPRKNLAGLFHPFLPRPTLEQVLNSF